MSSSRKKSAVSVPTKRQEFGSNIKAHKALIAVQQALVKRRIEPHRRAERKFLRARAALLKPMAKPAKAIFSQTDPAYAQAFLRAGGDGAAIANARRGARRALDRALRENFAAYRDYEALRRDFAEESRALMDARRDASRVGELGLVIGGVPQRPPASSRLFAPPFALFDVAPAFSTDSRVKSFAVPHSGLVGMNVRIHAEGHDDSIIGFDFNPGFKGLMHALVGITFEVPQTGFLTGTVVMENLLNDFTVSLTDQFGFSDGRAHIEHAIAVRIVRSGEITSFDRQVYSNGILSFGGDFSFTESPIPRSTPFTLSFEGQDAFVKGERIQILAGTTLTMEGQLNDMTAVMSAFTVWQVKKLAIRIRG